MQLTETKALEKSMKVEYRLANLVAITSSCILLHARTCWPVDRRERNPFWLARSKVSIQTIPDTSEEKSFVELGTGGHKGNTTVIGTHGGRVALCEHKND